jgi:hypothetical protein
MLAKVIEKYDLAEINELFVIKKNLILYLIL